MKRGRDNEILLDGSVLEIGKLRGRACCILICFVLILWKVRRNSQFCVGLVDFKYLWTSKLRIQGKFGYTYRKLG